MVQFVRILSWILSRPVLLVWRLLDWRIEGAIPNLDKVILVGAPHTSNWDYLIFIGFAAHVRRRIMHFVKCEALRGPLGLLMRWSGAVGIDRTKSNNFVDSAVEVMNRMQRIVYAVTPEGTRKYTPYWKSGFYYIAQGTGVPLVLVAANYPKKRMYVSEPIHTTGDIEADMARIRDFFDRYGAGKYPEKATPVRVRPRDAVSEVQPW